ncbi:MAG: hypothetical protein ACREBH_01085 [Candidatus Micrarchaeaceae archaeon]
MTVVQMPWRSATPYFTRIESIGRQIFMSETPADYWTSMELLESRLLRGLKGNEAVEHMKNDPNFRDLLNERWFYLGSPERAWAQPQRMKNMSTNKSSYRFVEDTDNFTGMIAPLVIGVQKYGDRANSAMVLQIRKEIYAFEHCTPDIT